MKKRLGAVSGAMIDFTNRANAQDSIFKDYNGGFVKNKESELRNHTPRTWASREVFNRVEGTSNHVIVWRDGTKENHQYRRLDEGQAGRFKEADARLIAAAPEMFDALKTIFEWDKVNTSIAINTEGVEARNKIRSAIAKAEGR